MVPRELKHISPGRYRGQCTHCGKRLIIQYDAKGNPTQARIA